MTAKIAAMVLASAMLLPGCVAYPVQPVYVPPPPVYVPPPPVILRPYTYYPRRYYYMR